MSIANFLTFIRIFISPIFLLIYLEYEALSIPPIVLPYALLFLLVVSELSDAFDGYFARRFNEVTDFGKIIDPMADSIYRLSVFLTFTLPPIRLPMILIFVLFYRDSVISSLRTICALKGFALAARPSGKLKAILQGVAVLAITLLLIPYSLGYLAERDLHEMSTLIVGATCVYTVLSGVDYIYSNRKYLFRLLTMKSSESQAQT